MSTFQIKTLDHVAIRVSDLEASASWYQRVLGLERLQPKEWGPFPIFMVTADGTGVALFPSRSESPGRLPEGGVIEADHYAFQVDPPGLAQAQAQLTELGITFEWQDHHYHHSIYFSDPDGHRVEITAQVRAFE